VIPESGRRAGLGRRTGARIEQIRWMAKTEQLEWGGVRREAKTVRLGDYLDFSNGSTPPVRESNGRYPVYGANGAIGYAAQSNASGPLIVVGRVGSNCGSLRYCDSDVWVTDNALACRAKYPAETRYWYYALQTCRLNQHRAGSPSSIKMFYETF